MAEKSYRIKATVGEDVVLKAHLEQDVDFLEVLSLKIAEADIYKLHVSNYGIIVGRVLANEAFGIPNAKVSVFIKIEDEDLERSEIVNLYPYRDITTNDKNGKRYNLLSDSSTDECYRIVGTFPNKRLVLDNDTYIEIFDKYWKYTTVTNQSGDYMIFGVPSGNQTLHVDIDLSDIGILSQKPRDFYYQGYNQDLFDSAEQFKSSDNLDYLSQIMSHHTSVYVHPFYGDTSVGNIAITRCDVKIPYQFTPTCIFLGSIISDKQGEHIGHACGPSRWIGYNGRMKTGEGTIEMIRQTPDGLVEEFSIKNNHLINSDGVWCYQIPMNLDYIGTDEFGNIIPIHDSTKGIPTRTSVRFRITLQETYSSANKEHSAKYLVPNMHELIPDINTPTINGKNYESCFEFGSATPKNQFRDLLWNKVYTVKNYIPRFQMNNSKNSRNYSGIRSVGQDHENNVFPFNSAYFRLTFTYQVICTLVSMIIFVIGMYNHTIKEVLCFKLEKTFRILGKKVHLSFGRPLKFVTKWVHCIGIKGEKFFEERADYIYIPRCSGGCGSLAKTENKKPIYDDDALTDVVEQVLALEYDIVNLDFYNDWINGTLYMPLWYWKKRAKKKYLFGLFSSRAKNSFCNCDKGYNHLKLRQPCQDVYDESFLPINDFNESNNRHRDFTFGEKSIARGIIKEFTNANDLKIYYYSPGSPSSFGYNPTNHYVSYSRLYETDIVLLGSLNACDLDNMPQAFVGLPSSTANLPFIASFTESTEDTENVDNNTNIPIFVPGLDWEHDGGSTIPQYGKGVLMDLTCWNVRTRFKSCVNLSRMCELDVTQDMDILSDDESEPTIYHDGMITQYELLNHETRAKFASLNHNGLSILKKNITTNYDTYKMHYIYPTNFDGHLNRIAPHYTALYKQRTYDISDPNYVNYRLGENRDSSYNKKHKKHFYWGNEKKFSFPLYNNSFYFYFGLHEGKTAIDKFYSTYYASCSTQNKFPFTIEYIAKPGKWCYNTANTSSDFGTIDISFNGLTSSFSYSLVNEFNETLISETDVVSDDLRFGYDIQNGGGGYIVTSQDGYKKCGILKEFKTGNQVTNIFGEPVFLENGVYYLTVTNSAGMSNTIRINMIQNVLQPNFEEVKLGLKYTNNTLASSVCGDMDLNGELKIQSFIIDGEEVFITKCEPYYTDTVKHYYNIDNEIYYAINGKVTVNNVEYMEDENHCITIGDKTYESKPFDEPKELTCKVTCTDGSALYLIVEPEGSETTSISDFVCYGVGNVPSIDLEEYGEINGEQIYTLIVNIWKPGDYVITTNQICNDVMNDNVSINTFSIENGESFQAFINGIPLKIVMNDNFNKPNTNETIPQAWFQLENPSMYNFPSITMENVDFWGEIINVNVVKDENGNEYIDTDSKIAILQYQFQAMNQMMKGGYIVSENDVPSFTLTTQGGKEPILIRNIHPNFTELENNGICQSVVLDNINVVEAPSYNAYVIDRTHTLNGDGIWIYDPKIDERGQIRLNNTNYANTLIDKLGNYFAAFTNNGGMISLENSCKVDDDLFYLSAPLNAKPINQFCPQNAIIHNDYPKEVNNFFRTLFVDKRMTLFGNLYLPIYSNYDLGDETWKYGRTSVNIIGGLAMAYDEEYNVIGKETSQLEYYIQTDENGSSISLCQNTKVKKKYYSCTYIADGQEEDLTDKYTHYTSLQEGNGVHDSGYLNYARIDAPLQRGGNIINYKVVSCNLADNITYNDDSNEIKYFVEPNEELEVSILSGNRVILKDGEIEYSAKFNNNYIIVHGIKCPISIDKAIDETEQHLTLYPTGCQYEMNTTDYSWRRIWSGVCDEVDYVIQDNTTSYIYKGNEYNVNIVWYGYQIDNNEFLSIASGGAISLFKTKKNSSAKKYFIKLHNLTPYISDSIADTVNSEQGNGTWIVSWAPGSNLIKSYHVYEINGKYILGCYSNIDGDGVVLYLSSLSTNTSSNIYSCKIPVKYKYLNQGEVEKCSYSNFEEGEQLITIYQVKFKDSKGETITGETTNLKTIVLNGGNPYDIQFNEWNNKYYIIYEGELHFLTTLQGWKKDGEEFHSNIVYIEGLPYKETWQTIDSINEEFYSDLLKSKGGEFYYMENKQISSDTLNLETITIDNVVYSIHYTMFDIVKATRLNHMLCTVLLDSITEHFDKIECPAPILLSGYEEEYGFERDTLRIYEGNIPRVKLWDETIQQYTDSQIIERSSDTIYYTDQNDSSCVVVDGRLFEMTQYKEDKSNTELQKTPIKIWDFVKKIHGVYNDNLNSMIYEMKLIKNNIMQRINQLSYNAIDRIGLLNYQGWIKDTSLKDKWKVGSKTIGVMKPFLKSEYIDIVNNAEDATEADFTLPFGMMHSDYLAGHLPLQLQNGGLQERTGIYLYIPTFRWSSGDTETKITEKDEIANYITYKINESVNIPNNTQILTCCLLKTYYNDGRESNKFICIPTQNMSAQWDVRDVYITTILKTTDNITQILFVIYYHKDIALNQDIINYLDSYNEGNVVGKIIREQDRKSYDVTKVENDNGMQALTMLSVLNFETLQKTLVDRNVIKLYHQFKDEYEKDEKKLRFLPLEYITNNDLWYNSQSLPNPSWEMTIQRSNQKGYQLTFIKVNSMSAQTTTEFNLSSEDEQSAMAIRLHTMAHTWIVRGDANTNLWDIDSLSSCEDEFQGREGVCQVTGTVTTNATAYIFTASSFFKWDSVDKKNEYIYGRTLTQKEWEEFQDITLGNLYENFNNSQTKFILTIKNSINEYYVLNAIEEIPKYDYQYKNTGVYNNLAKIKGTIDDFHFDLWHYEKIDDCQYKVSQGGTTTDDVKQAINDNLSNNLIITLKDERYYNDITDECKWYVPCLGKGEYEEPDIMISFYPPRGNNNNMIDFTLRSILSGKHTYHFMKKDDILGNRGAISSLDGTPRSFDNVIWLLQFDFCSLGENDSIYGVQCNDGYSYYGLPSDTLNHLKNGTEIAPLRLKEMRTTSFVGESIIHMETVDGSNQCFNVKSVVVKEKQLSKKKFLLVETSADYLNENTKYKLSLSIQNMVYSFAFIYDDATKSLIIC